MKYRERCINCGKANHTNKNCYQPRTSYGLLLISPDPGLESPPLLGEDSTTEQMVDRLSYCRHHIRFLLVSRRVSLGFVELMLGRYDPSDINKIKSVFRQLYPSELGLVAREDYSLCLRHFLSHKHGIPSKYTNVYRMAEIKFQALVESKHRGLHYYLTHVDPDYTQPEWGIPKGRRSYPEESDIAVAMREFEEETGYTDYKVLRTPPIVEDMTGTNGVRYRHIYYLALDTGLRVRKKDSDPVEIGDVRLLRYDEVMAVLRPYHYRKKDIITQVFYMCYNGLHRSLAAT